jgi:intein/homing endonuclease
MSNKAIGADNQQATLALRGESSETICQAPFTKEEIIAYLNGALHDASLNKGKRFRFVQKYVDWLKKLQKLLEEVGYRSWIYKEGKNRNLYVLETLCKELDFTFNPKNVKTDREKIMYLRGFFDAEGGVPRIKGRFYIQLAQKNYQKILTIKKILMDLGIESGKIHNPSKKVDPDYWRIAILAKYHDVFAKTIYSWHPIKSKIFDERLKI